MRELKDLLAKEDKNGVEENDVEGEDKKLAEGEDLVKDLMVFEKPLNEHSIIFLFKTFSVLACETLKLMLTITGSVLIISSGFFFLNLTGNTLDLATFGMCQVLYLLSFISLMLSATDKMGIEMADAFGGKDYQKCKVVFGMGILNFLILFFAVTFPVLYWSEEVLLFLRISPTLAQSTKGPAQFYLLVGIIQLPTEVLQTFCVSQGHEAVFGHIGIMNLVVSVPLNYVTMCTLNLGIYGFILTRVIVDGIRLCLALLVYKKTHPETRGLDSLENTLANFKAYLYESFKFTLGTYSEFLGFEICGYLVALTGDNNQIAAYSALNNVCGLMYTTGISFSIISRTRVNILIGMKRPDIAKNFFLFFAFGSMGFGMIGGVIMFLSRNLMADLYAGNSEEARDWLSGCIALYSLITWSEFSMCGNAVGLKTIRQIEVLLKYCFFILLLGNFAGGVPIRYLGGNVWHLLSWCIFLAALLNVLIVRRCQQVDWEKASRRKLSAGHDSIVDMLQRDMPIHGFANH